MKRKCSTYILQYSHVEVEGKKIVISASIPTARNNNCTLYNVHLYKFRKIKSRHKNKEKNICDNDQNCAIYCNSCNKFFFLSCSFMETVSDLLDIFIYIIFFVALLTLFVSVFIYTCEYTTSIACTIQ